MTEKTPKTTDPDQAKDQTAAASKAPSSTSADKTASTAAKGTTNDRGATAASGATAAPAARDSKSTASVTSDKAATTSNADKAAGPSGGRPEKATTDKSPSPSDKPFAGKELSGKGSEKGPSNKGPSGPTAKDSEGLPPNGDKPSRLPLVLGTVVALGLAGALWYQHSTTRDAIAQLRLQTKASSDQAQKAQQQAQQALSALSQQSTKIDRLLADSRQSRDELRSLGDAFQMITDRGSDLVLLNDIDHLVTIAQQQLQLSGNVANAIISLETAQAQLARANRPNLASLQQTINGDLDRLRAATTVDIALLSDRLDELAGLVGQAPLLTPDDAAPDVIQEHDTEDQAAPSPSVSDTPAMSDQPWWERALSQTGDWTSRTLNSLRDDLGQFISVRRVDDATALLISPDQATRFRDNLRLRIMTAQLALMMGQSQIWQTETAALVDAVESRYDPKSPLTRQALKIARQVADTSIDTPLPTVTNSIKALEVLRERSAADSMSSESSSPAAAPSPAATARQDTATPSDRSVRPEPRESVDTPVDQQSGTVVEPSEEPDEQHSSAPSGDGGTEPDTPQNADEAVEEPPLTGQQADQDDEQIDQNGAESDQNESPTEPSEPQQDTNDEPQLTNDIEQGHESQPSGNEQPSEATEQTGTQGG